MVILHLDPLGDRPLYLQIVEQIEEAINSNRLTDGQPIWSARKIASHYHISYQTAERALAELARRGLVRRSVASGTVVCLSSQTQQICPAIRHRVIALISCWEVWGTQPTHTMSEMQISQAAAQRLASDLWGLIWAYPGSGDIKKGFSVAELAKWCHRVKFDGALVFGHMPERGLEWLHHQGYPVVVVDAEPIGPFPRVVHDNYGGMKAAVEHLLELGHTKIAFLRGDRPYHYSVRQKAYEDTLLQAGIQPDPELIISIRRPKPRVADAIKFWFSLPDSRRPTALAAGSDIIAAFVAQEAQKQGIRIPHDLSLTGYDDEPFAVAVHPPLTTLHVSWADMGIAGANLLLERLQNPYLHQEGETEPTRIVVPSQLVVRESTAPPASKT
ncbi:transcriptional regulator [Chthonomonas calidirosea]|uniref:Transcriptional regulators n=1 Tax=Chthonomonas calidirosea (strain DSM 23976 / ICMP 18418 / T49) TaxID=1303518 RepID=S0EX67_CHTCT|nr:GntR family transcriptional regulator [Chthonomonas calidirosea]CCW34378.1 Transcriptional regulators [Chthonomonas calidirosea T49]CEK14945.1 transcriptional regulator [Chthonomonas calidirosea]